MSLKWEFFKLKDLITLKTGKLDSNQEEINGTYPFFTCAPNPSRINSFAFNQKAILLAGNNANGNFHINYYEGKFNAFKKKIQEIFSQESDVTALNFGPVIIFVCCCVEMKRIHNVRIACDRIVRNNIYVL